MKNKRLISATLLILCMGLFYQSVAQDPNFTQYFSNPIYLNPAFAGAAGCSRVATNYRNQWPMITSNHITGSLTYDQPINKLSGGVGIQIMSDWAGGGTIKTNSVNGIYAFNLNINNDFHIRPALSVGYMIKTLNSEDLTTVIYDSISQTYQIVPLFDHNLSLGNFNIGAGFLATYKKFVFGFAIDHINEPEEGFINNSRLPVKWTFHANYEHEFSENLKLSPGIVYQQQRQSTFIQPSLMLKYHFIKLGVATRFNPQNTDCVIGMIGYSSNWLSVGYSYDYTVFKLKNMAGGTHEISAILRFNCMEKNENQRISVIDGF